MRRMLTLALAEPDGAALKAILSSLRELAPP